MGKAVTLNTVLLHTSVCVLTGKLYCQGEEERYSDLHRSWFRELRTFSHSCFQNTATTGKYMEYKIYNIPNMHYTAAPLACSQGCLPPITRWFVIMVILVGPSVRQRQGSENNTPSLLKFRFR